MIGGLGFIGVNLTARLLCRRRRRDGRDAVSRAARTSRRTAVRARRASGSSRATSASRTSMATVVVRPGPRSSTSPGSPARSRAWKIRGPISTSTAAAISCFSKRCAHKNPPGEAGVRRFASSIRQAGDPARHGRRRRPSRCACTPSTSSVVEQYLHLYATLFGLRYTVARVTNPYGPGQPDGRTAYGIINRSIQLALADQPLTVYGDGAAAARLRSRGRCGDGAAGVGRIAGERGAASTTSAAASGTRMFEWRS